MTPRPTAAAAPSRRRPSWVALVALLLLGLLASLVPATAAIAQEVPPDEPPTEEPPGPIPPSTSPNWPHEMVSRGPGGVPADGESTDASISADGSTVAFASYATNLRSGSTPTSSGGNVFARNLTTGTNELASIRADGSRVTFPRHTTIDADGSTVVMTQDTNENRGLFRRDRTNSTGGTIGQGAGLGAPAVDAAGERVAYVQYDVNPFDDDDRSQVWAYGEGGIHKLSNVTGLTHLAVRPSISGDGNTVAYEVQQDRAREVRVHDITGLGSPLPAPVVVPGGQWPSLSGNGRMLAYARYESASNTQNLRLLDRVTGDDRLLFQLPSGVEPVELELSADGSTLAYVANKWSDRDDAFPHEVWVTRVANGATEVVTDIQCCGGDNDLGITADGRTIVVATDVDGLIPEDTNRESDVFVFRQVDGGGPVFPAGAALTVDDVSSSFVALRWPAATDDRAVTGYRLQRGENGPVLALGPTTTTATVTGLAPETEYRFTVTAVDEDGHGSAPLHVNVWTEPAPTEGTAALQVTTSGGTATLRWDEAQGDVLGYQVLRAAGSGDLTPVADVPAGTAEHVDRGLTAGTQYRYQIVVLRSRGEAVHSVEASATTGTPSVAEVIWSGRGRIGTPLDITLGAAPGWQGSVEVTSNRWYGDDGELLPAPQPVTTTLPAAEDTGAPGTYRAGFPITEGTAEVTSITGVLTDGAGAQARRDATRLPLAVLGSLQVDVVAPAGGIPGGRLVIGNVGQLALDGGATFAAPAVVPGTHTALVRSARGTELGSETVTVHAGRHASVTITPRLPATSVVRVTKVDSEPLGGSNVTFATLPGNTPIGTATSDSQGIARLDTELFAGAALAVTAAPPGRLPYGGATRTLALAPGENLEHIVLPSLPRGSLSGIVTLEDGTPAAAARVVLSQTVGGRSFGATTDTGSDGRYTLEGMAGEGAVVVSYRSDPAFSAGTVTLGEAPVTLDVSLPAPERYQVELSLYSRSHEQAEWQGPLDIDYGTAIHLDLRVKTPSGSKLLTGRESTIDAQEGDEIQVCVDGDEAGMTSPCTTVTLGASRRVPLELRMESAATIRGHLLASNGQPIDPAQIQTVTASRLTDDGKSHYLYGYRAHHGAFEIPVAAAGRYRLVASAYSNSYSYAAPTSTIEVDVPADAVVDVGTLTLSSSTWARRSAVTASQREVPAGARFDLRTVLHQGRIGDVNDAVARITLPAGTSLVPESLTLDGRPVPATVVDGALEVELGDRRFNTFDNLVEAWVLRYQLATDGVTPGDDLQTTTHVRVPAENAGIPHLAGAVTVHVAAVTLDAPDRTSTRTLELSGRAPAGTAVRLRDGTTHLGDATAGAGGLWRLSVTLPDLGNGETHELSAGVTLDGTELVSDPVQVMVDERYPILEQVEMSRPNGTRVTIDPQAGVARFPYIYGGSQIDLSLRFGGRGNVEDVTGQVGLYRGPAVQTGDTTWEARIPTGHQSLGGIGVDYTPLPEVSDLDDERKPTEGEVRNRLPAPVADYRDPVVTDESDPATGIRRSTATVRTPSLGPDATLKTSLSIQRGVEYTPTAADFEAVRKAGVQLYGADYDYALGSDSLRVTMNGYMPEALLDEQAPAARSLGATAIPLPPVRFVRVAFETNFTRAQTLDSLYTAAQTGDKYERLNNLLDWVSNNCGPFHQSMYRDQLQEMNKRALTNDATHAGLMLAGVLLAPETLGIGTLAVWGTTFFLDKLADHFMDGAISKLVENVKDDCRDRDEDDPDRDDRDNPDHPVADPVWIHDPSGYVFEAVPSNRVQGATATLFGSSAPDGQFTTWDAEWYGQTNPLVTDGEGRYGWDVPEGFWQVVVTKDGHEAGRSAVLEVLPPHFDVNIPIVNPAAPEVRKVGAVAGAAPAVSVGFSRYMQLGVAADRRITVTDADGNAIDGAIEPVDAEDGPTGRFARTFRFVPARSLTTGEVLTVNVDELATSYAGSPLAGPFTTQVTVTDPPPPAAPTAGNDEADLDEDTSAVVDVLANDNDPQGDALTAEVVTPPTHGTATVSDGKLAFTPAADWHGIDTFTYRAGDGTSASEPATVTVIVRPVNDNPVADDDAVTGDEDSFTTIAVLDGDTDADGNPLSVKALAQPAHGTTSIAADGSITYVPEANWSGTDTFTYSAGDGVSSSPPATVTVTVRPVNDAPVAVADSASTATGTAVMVPVLANDSDVDGDALTATIAQAPDNGTAEVVPGGIRFTPASGWTGTATFTYRAADAALTSEAVPVTITVTAPVTHPLVTEFDQLATKLKLPAALATRLRARIGAAAAEAASGDDLGVVKEIAAYMGEVQLAEKRKEISGKQATQLRSFGAKALLQLLD